MEERWFESRRMWGAIFSIAALLSIHFGQPIISECLVILSAGLGLRSFVVPKR